MTNRTVGDRIVEIAARRNLPTGRALADHLGVTYEALRQLQLLPH